MKQGPNINKKIVNNQGDNDVQRSEQKPPQTGKKKDKNKKPLLTTADLKGKKVDGDPELESDQPLEQIY